MPTSKTTTRQRASSAAQLDSGAFTPPWLVKRVLSHKVARRHLRAKENIILNPLAGDGNFFVSMILERLRIHKDLDSLFTIYAIEPHEGKIANLRERVSDLLKAKGFENFEDFLNENIICEDYLSDSYVPPKNISLIVGNPSLQPGRKYQNFCSKSLATGADVLFIVPTNWLYNNSQTKFAASISPHLQQPVEKLGWDSFSVKMRTCLIWLKRGTSRSPKLDFQQDSVWLAAAQTWEKTLQDFVKGTGRVEAYIGWKSNSEKGTGKINAFQSIAFDKNDPGLPTHYTTLHFKNVTERKNFAKFMTTKLVAYLQTCTDSDNVSMAIPVPPLTLSSYDDKSLMRELDLTKIERDTVEVFDLYLSGKAAAFFKSQKIAIRKDTIVGVLRKGCPECGSSSFHRKGCSYSTAREKSVRDS